MLATRVLTAVVALAVFLAVLLFLGRTAFAVFVGVVIALAAREWGALSGLPTPGASAYAAGCALAFGAAAWALGPEGLREHRTAAAALFGGSSALWLAASPVWLARGMGNARPWLLRGAGFLALLPAALAAVQLRPYDLLLALGLVWIADTAAYFGGTAFGRTKLAPTLSPGKTWEGVAAAAVACVGYAMMLAWAAPQTAGAGERIGWGGWIAASIVLCAAAVLGDLFKSAAKRRAGVKDSGSLLPGHGGILDRIDSALPVLPLAALLALWVRAP